MYNIKHYINNMCNIKHAYRAIPRPHHGQSDHLSLLFTPAYTHYRTRTRPATKTVTTWPEDAIPQLKECFAQELLEHQDRAHSVCTTIHQVL